MKSFVKIIVGSLFFLFLGKHQAFCSNVGTKSTELIIIDSWLTGYVNGFCTAKDHRFKTAWKKGTHCAAMDARIWGGLFVTDTNQRKAKRTGEFLSRFTYQLPQTLVGFGTAQFYNTIACKVNSVEYACGASVVNCNVNWAGVSLGNYILAKPIIHALPNNKMFQHEYGHYLQSKRMGHAYFIRVGIPAILSKGDHDAHPVEVDCNREAFLYFNSNYPNFKNDSILNDTLGWNFRYNPFPSSVGTPKSFKSTTLIYIDYKKDSTENELASLKVRSTFFDHASWLLPPLQIVVGISNAHKYNKHATPLKWNPD